VERKTGLRIVLSWLRVTANSNNADTGQDENFDSEAVMVGELARFLT
jgi:hypothetical protein